MAELIAFARENARTLRRRRHAGDDPAYATPSRSAEPRRPNNAQGHSADPRPRPAAHPPRHGPRRRDRHRRRQLSGRERRPGGGPPRRAQRHRGARRHPDADAARRLSSTKQAIGMEVVGDPKQARADAQGLRQDRQEARAGDEADARSSASPSTTGSKGAYAIVQTGERRLYGNVLLKKGIIRPMPELAPTERIRTKVGLDTLAC